MKARSVIEDRANVFGAFWNKIIKRIWQKHKDPNCNVYGENPVA